MKRTFWNLIFFACSSIVFADEPKLQKQTNQSLPGESIQSQLTIRLPQALEAAILKNPKFLASDLAIKEKRGERIQAGVFPNPKLIVDLENFSGSGLYSGTRFMETQFGFEQPIFLGGKINKRKQIADLDLLIAKTQQNIDLNELMALVEKRFYAVLTAQEQLKVNIEQLEIIKKTNWVVQKRVTAGEASPVDQIKTKIEIGSAEIKVNLSRKNLKTAQKQLSELWAENENRDFQVIGTFRNTSDVSFDRLVDSLRKSPIWKFNELIVKKTEAELALEKANRIPDLDLNGGVKRFSETKDHAAFLGFSIDLPVFDRNQGQLAEKKASVKKMVYLKHSNNNSLISKLNSNWNEFRAQRTILQDLDMNLIPASKSAFQAMEKLYSAGEIDILPLLDAQRTWIQTQGQRIEVLALIEENFIEISRIVGSTNSHINKTSVSK